MGYLFILERYHGMFFLFKRDAMVYFFYSGEILYHGTVSNTSQLRSCAVARRPSLWRWTEERRTERRGPSSQEPFFTGPSTPPPSAIRVSCAPSVSLTVNWGEKRREQYVFFILERYNSIFCYSREITWNVFYSREIPWYVFFFFFFLF